MSESIILLAKHLHTIFHNEGNGYTVAKFVTYDTNEEDFTATGYFREIDDDVIYKLHGDYTDHPRYGMQFQVVAYEKMLPNDETSLVRFFASPLFPGIGKQTAKTLVDTLGETCIERIKEDAQVLFQVPGMNERKRTAILEGIKQHDQVDDSTAFFTQFGVSIRNIMKFEAIYGDEAVSIIKENPYRLIEEIDGIGFKTADKLAKELDFEMDHPYRMKAAVLSTILDLCMANGDTYTTTDVIEKRMMKEFPAIHITEILDSLETEYLIHMEDDRIYHHTQYDSEKGIASFLSMFPYLDQEKCSHKDIEHAISNLEDTLHISYEKKQKNAISSFFDEPFSIITGGPGTGKTTIVQGILDIYRNQYPSDMIGCAAPTGRASKRLSEVSGCSASTIHSLLRWDLESNTFLVNEKEPLQLDLLIIDEFSMVDAWLFYHLVIACRFVKKILIIGDEDQLPSVGCGCVLKDLIASNLFKVTRLEKIFRQSEGSDVITLAHEIRDEEIKVLEQAKDIAFFECQNYEVRDVLLQVVSNALDKNYHPKDIQVLAPMYGGVAGIDALNNALQKMMNPQDGYKKEIKVGYRIFREHDKVLQLKNQPEDEVFNGDIGEIIEITYADNHVFQKQTITIDFDGILVEYSGEQIFNITHAFCISIHKSQGSEYPIVIMPIVKDYTYMLSKRLVYTGVTRAKKSLVLLGSKDVFLHAIQMKERHLRKSTLTERLQAFFG